MNIFVNKSAIYKLPLKSLSIGEHTFKYHLDDEYFSNIDSAEITKGDVNAVVTVVKSSLNIEIHIELTGIAQTTCDRCLDPLEVEIESEQVVFVKYGDEYREESEVLFVIPEQEGVFDIAWLLFEYVALSIPMTHSHEEGDCNENMIDILNQHKVSNFDEDEDENNSVKEKKNNEVDPRWAALKDILKH
ncbi:MAG: DUF177 domain-containing protein [bacterium]